MKIHFEPNYVTGSNLGVEYTEVNWIGKALVPLLIQVEIGKK